MARVYTEEERRLFAEYVHVRAEVRPVQCTGDGMCWVEYGPPAMTTKGGTVGHCLGCDGAPVIPWGFRGKLHGGRRKKPRQ